MGQFFLSLTPTDYLSGTENFVRRLALFLILIVLASGGCRRGIGPQRLPIDRTAYIEALGDSWKEQLLFNIVKLRYGDAPTFLDISQITQTYTLDASVTAGYDVGWGSGTKNRTTVGGINTTTQRVLPLLPSHGLSAGVTSAYRSSPVITFSPITGDVIEKTIFTRLAPIRIFKALQSGWQIDFIIPYCFISLNNVAGISKKMSELVEVWDRLDSQNAIFYTFEEEKETENEAENNEGAKGKPNKKGEKTKGSKPKPTPWDKFADNLVEFTSNLVKKQKDKAPKKTKVAIINLNKKKAKDADFKDFKKLLNLKETKGTTSTEKDKHIEQYQVVPGPPKNEKDFDKIYVVSRSVYQILTMLAKYIEVPPSHKEPLTGEPWVWPGEEEKKWYKIPSFHVKFKTVLRKPNAFATIKYQGHWFYIPHDYSDTKRVFSGLIAIFSMMETAPKKEPILTIPVR